jgi:hypothetical protein
MTPVYYISSILKKWPVYYISSIRKIWLQYTISPVYLRIWLQYTISPVYLKIWLQYTISPVYLKYVSALLNNMFKKIKNAVGSTYSERTQHLNAMFCYVCKIGWHPSRIGHQQRIQCFLVPYSGENSTNYTYIFVY